MVLGSKVLKKGALRPSIPVLLATLGCPASFITEICTNALAFWNGAAPYIGVNTRTDLHGAVTGLSSFEMLEDTYSIKWRHILTGVTATIEIDRGHNDFIVMIEQEKVS